MHLDCHMHILEGAANPAGLLQHMRAAGIDGACIISLPPKDWRDNRLVAISATERLENLHAWSSGASSLHPLFWIDPTDPDALPHVEQAVRAGVAGAPGQEAQNKPLLFHSGILWDGCASSEFNRPAAFEALLEVPRLRFALAHMSWPWLDECLAVYGKFLNARKVRSEAPEMFIDLTPGTPEIYRAEALTKLFTVGYAVAENVLFGTDVNTQEYDVPWASAWQARDQAILEKLGIGERIRRQYFGGNLLRWLSGAQPPAGK